jgi:hypothetical protein
MRDGPMSKNKIERDHAGALGPLGAGQKAVRDVLNRAVSDGDLIELPNPGQGGGHILDVPGSDQ